MPERTPCRFCNRVGLVRREHVITRGRSFITFYCGACDRSWEVPEPEPPVGRPTDEPVDRSNPR